MIIVLHGADEFRISERVKAVRLSVVPGDLSDINTTFLNAADCDLEELFLTASVVPFMAEQRLVIARDFIKVMANRSPGSTGYAGRGRELPPEHDHALTLHGAEDERCDCRPNPGACR